MRRKEDDRLVLIDFGAVKQIRSLTPNSQGQTSITVAVGTDGYMPNEQSNGHPKLASDIYAVGMIGIQVLTGVDPINLSRDPNTGQILWRNQVQVSDRLRRFLDKMVHEYHQSRYQDASEALQELKLISQKPTLRLVLVGLAVVAITGIAVIIGIIVNHGLPFPPQLIEPSPTTDVDPSRYTKLEEYLEAGEWREADQETYSVMLKVAGGKLESEDLKNFSCPDLREIDRLWVQYSQGHFGFSVQKGSTTAQENTDIY